MTTPISQELIKRANEVFPSEKDSQGFLNEFKTFMDLDNYVKIHWYWIGKNTNIKNYLMDEIKNMYSFIWKHKHFEYNGNVIIHVDDMPLSVPYAQVITSTDFSNATIKSVNIPKVSDKVKEFITKNYPDTKNIKTFIDTLEKVLEKPKNYNMHVWYWMGENIAAKNYIMSFLKQEKLAKGATIGLMIGDYCCVNFDIFGQSRGNCVDADFPLKKDLNPFKELEEKQKAERFELVKNNIDKFSLVSKSYFCFVCGKFQGSLGEHFIYKEVDCCNDCYLKCSPIKKIVKMTEKEFLEYMEFKNKGD